MLSSGWILLLILPVADGMVHAEYDFDYPSCSCKFQPILQSIAYYDEKRISRSLSEWEGGVTDLRFTPWRIYPPSMNFTYNRTGVAAAYSCRPHGVDAKGVSYKLPVDPPIFLKPFVGHMVASQTKTQYLLHCTDRFVFVEDVHICNLPIIGEMDLKVFSMFSDGVKPVARVHINHKDLPWYMSFVEPRLQNEIVQKSKRLWRIVIGELCGC